MDWGGVKMVQGWVKFTLFLFYILFLISCSNLRHKPDLNAPTETAPEPLPTPETQPESNLGRIDIDCDNTCTTEEKKQLIILTDLVNQVWWGKCFKDYFMEKETFYFTSMGSKQIIDALRDGNIKTTLTYFYKRKNPFTGSVVVGFENGDGKIHANRYAWSGLNTEEKVSNIVHELTHQKGFKHDGNSYKGNENTVPYQANEAVESCFD